MKKNQNFALPTFSSPDPASYAGEFAGQYIAAALLSAKTLDNKYVEIHPNVKFKEVIQKLAVSGIVQDASCDFVTSGSVALHYLKEFYNQKNYKLTCHYVSKNS